MQAGDPQGLCRSRLLPSWLPADPTSPGQRSRTKPCKAGRILDPARDVNHASGSVISSIQPS